MLLSRQVNLSKFREAFVNRFWPFLRQTLQNLPVFFLELKIKKGFFCDFVHENIIG